MSRSALGSPRWTSTRKVQTTQGSPRCLPGLHPASPKALSHLLQVTKKSFVYLWPLIHSLIPALVKVCTLLLSRTLPTPASTAWTSSSLSLVLPRRWQSLPEIHGQGRGVSGMKSRTWAESHGCDLGSQAGGRGGGRGDLHPAMGLWSAALPGVPGTRFRICTEWQGRDQQVTLHLKVGTGSSWGVPGEGHQVTRVLSHEGRRFTRVLSHDGR